MVIGITGGSGSGKTTVVKQIVSHLPANCVSVLYQDSYYRDNSSLPLEERQKINFDHPSSIEFDLLQTHLHELMSGRSVDQPEYSFVTCTRQPQVHRTEPCPVIIVEGILLFACAELLPFFDLKVFVDADADDRLVRIIQRDMEERGRGLKTVLHRYYETVKPMHLQFVEPYKRLSDIIIPGGGLNNVAIDAIARFALHKIQNP
jgi:uridine kinase